MSLPEQRRSPECLGGRTTPSEPEVPSSLQSCPSRRCQIRCWVSSLFRVLHLRDEKSSTLGAIAVPLLGGAWPASGHERRHTVLADDCNNPTDLRRDRESTDRSVSGAIPSLMFRWIDGRPRRNVRATRQFVATFDCLVATDHAPGPWYGVTD